MGMLIDGIGNRCGALSAPAMSDEKRTRLLMAAILAAGCMASRSEWHLDAVMSGVDRIWGEVYP